MSKGQPRPQYVKDAIREKLLARYADPQIKQQFLSVVRECNSKLTPSVAADIRRMRSEGIGWSEIANRVGVARSTLQKWRGNAGLRVERRSRWTQDDDALLRSVVSKLSQRLHRSNKAIAARILELDDDLASEEAIVGMKKAA